MTRKHVGGVTNEVASFTNGALTWKCVGGVTNEEASFTDGTIAHNHAFDRLHLLVFGSLIYASEMKALSEQMYALLF